MEKEEIAKRLTELRVMQKSRANPGMDLLETAMFLEDVFGIRLDESEIDEAFLGPTADLVAFTAYKLGGS
ncbi:hypothetical protein [Marispirochaeta sp.]|jgi:hypothetical protein|uniref:hypothetical protein n=1 Tax=Marispirochaeta sp. TaxID=2038653 RepID=UPI0029C76B29|nr:hypothetical protein [Marispirochaeta sp.]